jgi:hypothetical protein
MALFPASERESAPVGAEPALRVSTKYMENFLPLQPVSSGTEIHTFLNSNGALDIYSVGSDNQVYRLRRSKDQSAPYDEVDLGINASQLYLFAPANSGPDTPSIFGLDGTGKLTLASWQAGGYFQRQTGPDNDVIRRFLGVRGVSGRIYINVRLDDGRLGNNYYDPINDKWGGAAWAPVLGPDGKDAKVKTFTMAANNPYQSALFAIGMDDEVLFAEESFRTSQLRKLFKKASHIAAITDSENLLNIFVVERDTRLLWVKKQRKHSVSGIQFEDWVQVDPGQAWKLGQLSANLRRDGLIEVFALDDQGDLLYTRQRVDGLGRLAGWQVLFPIDARMENAIFALGRNANGYSEAFSVTAANELYRFWQSPETAQWFSEVLDVPRREDKLMAVPTHATEVFVVDATGAPLAGAKTTINAAFLSTLWVDGRSYRSSIVDPVTLTTDATGKIVILQRANALAGATLLFSTPRTPAGQPIKVEPNSELQARMAKLTTTDVLNAKDKEGNLVLPPGTKDRDRVAESIAEITKRSMDIAQADEQASAIQYKFASPGVTGFQLHSNFSALNGTAWEIDFSSGVPIYNPSSIAAVEAYRSEHAALMTTDGGFLGIDWGAVWNAIKKAVKWVIDGLTKIIVWIVNGIIKVLFEIAGKIFEAVIKFVQQAFDFIEGVWNYLKVKLEQLFEWLAFLFNFKDFARTAQGVKHAIGVTLDFAADAIHAVRDQVENGFDGLKRELGGIVDKLIADLNAQGNPTNNSYFTQKQATTDQQHATDHNIFLNAYQQNESRIKVNQGSMSAAIALGDPLEGLFDKLQSLADNFEFGDGKQAFDEAFAYFDNIGSNPNNALQLLLSGVVKALEGVAFFAIDFAKGVVVTIFDVLEDIIRVFRDALFEKWEIPVVSQLYELFTGEKLTITPVDVCAWVVGIPMTILSKVILGRTPWDDDQLRQFEQTFTVDMLKRRLGLGSEAELAAASDAWNPAWRENFLSGYCAAMVVRALVDPGAIGANSTGAGLGPAGIVPVALRYFSTVFTAPWALSKEAGAPNCKPGEPGFGVTIWICQLIFGPTRGMAIHYVMPPGPAKIYAGELTLTLWGVAHLFMGAWNFGSQEHNTKNNLAFSRWILNVIPGQTLHFLAVPAINQPAFFIPAIALGVLNFVAFLGSMGVAIAEIHTD